LTIFVSTGGVRNKSATFTAKQMINHGIAAVELSGGAYEVDAELKVLSLDTDPLVKIQIHNYYPPPKKPFVLNLASEEPLVLAESIAHAKKAIQLASKISKKTVSFHAGFLFNPLPSELGKHMNIKSLLNRSDGFEIFCNSIRLLDDFAAKFQVQLLVENNVLTVPNFEKFNQSPLLLCEPEEIVKFFGSVSDRVGLLLDVGHLKVSANTLGFDAVSGILELAPYVQGYHLSDNDGTADTNQSINYDSWFWKHLKRQAEFYTLEVYGLGEKELLYQIEITKNIICRNDGKN